MLFHILQNNDKTLCECYFNGICRLSSLKNETNVLNADTMDSIIELFQDIIEWVQKHPKEKVYKITTTVTNFPNNNKNYYEQYWSKLFRYGVLGISEKNIKAHDDF